MQPKMSLYVGVKILNGMLTCLCQAFYGEKQRCGVTVDYPSIQIEHLTLTRFLCVCACKNFQDDRFRSLGFSINTREINKRVSRVKIFK